MAKSYSEVASQEVIEIKSKEDFGDRPWTVLIKARELSVTPIDVLDALRDEYDPFSIQKTQFSDYLVTVKTPELKDKILSEGKVKIKGTEVGVQDPDTNITYVSVFYSPFEIAEEFYEEQLKSYGKVKFVRRNKIPGTEVENGITTVCMELEKHLPSFLQVGAYTGMLRYNGQPRTCRKWDQVGHLATACKEVRCYNCGSPGHVKKGCPKQRVCSLCREPGHSLGDCPTFWYPSMAENEVQDEDEAAEVIMEEEIEEVVEEPEDKPVKRRVPKTDSPATTHKSLSSASSVSSLESTTANRNQIQTKYDHQTAKRALSTNSEETEKQETTKKKREVKKRCTTKDSLSEEQQEIYGMLGLKGLLHNQINDLLSQAKTPELLKNLRRYAFSDKPLGKEFVKNWEI